MSLFTELPSVSVGSSGVSVKMVPTRLPTFAYWIVLAVKVLFAKGGRSVQWRLAELELYHNALVIFAWLTEQQANTPNTVRRTNCFFIVAFSAARRTGPARVLVILY